MPAKKMGLGRGLGALIKDAAAAETKEERSGAARIPLASIRRSPWQPRHHFEEVALAELVQSVKEKGVLQPLLVRHADGGFELIAGERRLRAAQEAGLADVPVIVMDVTDREALELALVENLQRDDLNLIEEAEGYRALADKFQLTQEDIARRVGRARPTVANALRLLDLPDGVKRAVAEGLVTPGHAKALLGLEIPREQELLAARVVAEGLSVRTLERIVGRLRRGPRKARAEKTDIPAEHVKYLLNELHQRLGTNVRITPSRTLANGKKVKGSIEIDYYSSDDLDRILVILGLSGTL
jgi:ParB family transcriptional regulator, chromosome partitioning protein